MSDLLDIRTWSILQWVLVVLAAGFIGQFGKSFAQFIMAKVKDRRFAGKTPATLSVPVGRGKMTPETPSLPTGNGDIPPESSYPARDVSNTTTGSSTFPKADETALPLISDKKALKAILKQRKKAVKASK